MRAQDRFSAATRAAEERWHDLKKAHKIMERAAEEDPVGTMRQLLDFLRRERRLWRRYLRSRYGIEFRYVVGPGDALAGRRVVVETHDGGDVRVLLPREGEPPPEKFDKWILVAPERLPPTPFGWPDVLETAGRLELWNTAWNLMNDLNLALKEKGCGTKVIAALACKMWLHVARQEPIFMARHIEPETDELSPLTREVAATELTGWMRARTSLTQNKRLREVLAEGGGRPEDKLMQELPGAVLAEWPHWRQEGAEGIARRVFRQLERGGDQALDLARKGKRADAELDAVSKSDAREGFGPEEDLAKLELRETRRQQSRQLDALERVAGLSPQQTAVWHRRRRGMERAEIAAELGIPKGQVSVVLHDAVKKMSEARKAAGL